MRETEIAENLDSSDNEADADVLPGDEAIQKALGHIDYHAIDIKGKQVRLTDPDVKLDLGGIAKGYIGGSYLGARAVIEACEGVYHNELANGPKIYFCGNSISPSALNDIIALTKGKRFSINVISKSGTTTETALAFRVLRKLLVDAVGEQEIRIQHSR